MRNKGFSLIEFTIVIAITTVIGLAISFNFLAASRFRMATQDNIALSREARIATNHMTRVLRFAITNDDGRPITAGSNQISATIAEGHLNFILVDTAIVYDRDTDDNTLEYTQGEEDAVVIAGGGERDIDITHFEGSWDGTELEIELTAENGRSVSLLTRIKPIGE